MDTASPSPRLPGRPGGSSGADLLAIARDLFLERQYSGTTMDAVAAAARISKQTLYRQYPSKDDLYAAVVRDWVDRGRDAMRPHLDALMAAEDAASGLRTLAGVLQAGVLSRPVLRMRSLVAAEAERFPEVAADYVRRSWDRNQALLADALAHLADRGLLHIDRPSAAAEQFTWLALAAPLNTPHPDRRRGRPLPGRTRRARRRGGSDLRGPLRAAGAPRLTAHVRRSAAGRPRPVRACRWAPIHWIGA